MGSCALTSYLCEFRKLKLARAIFLCVIILESKLGIPSLWMRVHLTCMLDRCNSFPYLKPLNVREMEFIFVGELYLIL